jgi:phosphoribosylformimino-5-aminoimidazole carboxamide ribotide isomerase
VSGWQEDSGISIYDCIKDLLSEGVTQVICTDISKDGSLAGPAIELYKNILKNGNNFNLIASGGISCLQDIMDVEQVGCKEVIVGKALYEGRVQLSELKSFSI